MSTQVPSRADQAVAIFSSGFNCAQAILLACGCPRGVDRLQAQRFASALGGGIAHQGQVCGALTGAALLVGYLLPKTDTQDLRPRANQLIGELFQAFRARQGAILCRDLLGLELSTPEGVRRFRELELRQKRCAPAVRLAAELLEELLAREGMR